MAYWKVRQGCVATAETAIATVLLCRAYYWGSSRACRVQGPNPNSEMKPGMLQAIERQISKSDHRKCRVVFVIAGDVGDLRHRKRLFHQGKLYVDPREYSLKHRELMAKIQEQLAIHRRVHGVSAEVPDGRVLVP